MTETDSTVRLENKRKRKVSVWAGAFAGTLIFCSDILYKFYNTFIVFRPIVIYSSRGG